MFDNELTLEDSVKLHIYNQEVVLTYRVRKYKKIENQNKEYLQQLKKQGIKLKLCTKLVDNKIEKCFYKLETVDLVGLEEKKSIINNILNTKNPEFEYALWEEISENNNNKTINKDTNLSDKGATVLNALSNYMLGGYETDDILNDKRWEKIKQYEVAQFSEYAYSKEKVDRSSEIYNSKETSTECKMKRFNKKYKKQISTWRNSKTYRAINLYSYDNHKDNCVEWDWINCCWRKLDEKFHWRRDGLIDPEKKYHSEWCLVDTDGKFLYKGCNCLVLDKNYAKENTKDIDEGYFKMDKLLVLEQDGILYYFNQDIKKINNKKIKRIKGD